MTWMTERSRPRIFAEPLGENSWRVCSNDAETSLLDHTIGFIDEFGGTYEVRTIEAPSERQYVATFKEAMDCFEPEGQDAAAVVEMPSELSAAGQEPDAQAADPASARQAS